MSMAPYGRDDLVLRHRTGGTPIGAWDLRCQGEQRGSPGRDGGRHGSFTGGSGGVSATRRRGASAKDA